LPTGTRPAPPNGTCRLTFNGTIQGHKWALVVWLQLTAASPSVTDLNALLVLINSAYGTRFKPLLATDCIMNLMQGVWIPSTGTEIVASNGTVQTGSVGEAAVNDASACFVISHHISSYYRGGHPRSYLPGLRASAVTVGSDISGAVQTSMALAWTNFTSDVNAMTTGGITGVILGTVRFQSGDVWLTPPQFKPWLSSTVRTKIGTQRRRILA
jgi:hypothetical protein